MNLWILVGEGIECEQETRIFFEKLAYFKEIVEVPVAQLLDKNPSELPGQEGDYFFFPGGFSFSDHFGAGRMLAFEISKIGLIDHIKNKKMHAFGVCNGFQVLCHTGCFGSEVRLLANQDSKSKKAMSFCNRWVSMKCELEGVDPEQSTLRLPVRHGEGRLDWSGKLQDNVRPFLRYNDEDFDNGSREQAAGLCARGPGWSFWGMMPHPEIALRKISDPDVVGSEFFPKLRAGNLENDGHGARLFAWIKTAIENGGD